jgi:pimeloyl-ACP methyl ester carboxylesterase
MKLELLRAQGSQTNVAVLRYIPSRPRGIGIVAAHGYSSSKQNLDPLCAFLAGHGFEVFSLDFPGHKLGASGGTLRSLDDCLDAAEAVVELARPAVGAPYLLGHSLGAITSLIEASNDVAVPGVVAIATGYGRPAALEALQKTMHTDLRAAYVDGATLPELMATVDERLAAALPGLAGRPALYVLAERDAMVSPSSVLRLYEQAPEPKRLARIESNHTFAGEHARTEVLHWLNELHPRR